MNAEQRSHAHVGLRQTTKGGIKGIMLQHSAHCRSQAPMMYGVTCGLMQSAACRPGDFGHSRARTHLWGPEAGRQQSACCRHLPPTQACCHACAWAVRGPVPQLPAHGRWGFAVCPATCMRSQHGLDTAAMQAVAHDARGSEGCILSLAGSMSSHNEHWHVHHSCCC